MSVKDEPWETTRDNSEEAVSAAACMLRRQGRGVLHIVRDPAREDEGDLLVYNFGDAGIWNVRTWDVKRNYNWDGECAFPFDTVFLTANGQLHMDWVYLVFNVQLTRCFAIDMRRVPPGEAGEKETLNRRGKAQTSQEIPMKYAHHIW